MRFLSAMRRTDTRPSSGERPDTPPGGEGNGGEGREPFSANAQHGGAAASSNAIAELANALQQVLRMINEGGAAAPTDLRRRAVHELERSGRPGEEREETRHALVAAGMGRGDRGRRNAGHGGKASETAGEANRTPCR